MYVVSSFKGPRITEGGPNLYLAKNVLEIKFHS